MLVFNTTIIALAVVGQEIVIVKVMSNKRKCNNCSIVLFRVSGPHAPRGSKLQALHLVDTDFNFTFGLASIDKL